MADIADQTDNCEAAARGEMYDTIGQLPSPSKFLLAKLLTHHHLFERHKEIETDAAI